jgi:release factor glutamine methyltransferase
MVLRDALKKGIEILKYANIDAPAVEAGVMLCSVLECDRVYIYAHENRVLSDEERTKFFSMIKMRTKGMPVQYITGHQEFMSLDFIVKPGVLIPRQDTEVVVEFVMGYTKSLSSHVGPLKILDIGTGSGCIAISLAHYINNSFVTGLDISEEALEIAGLNALRLGVADRVAFEKCDVLSKLKGQRFRQQYDIIVSNPPYIPEGDIAGLQREVKDYEPAIALDGGKDGLDFYRSIVSSALNCLKPHGLLAFEVGMGQAKTVKRLMEANFYDIKTIKDISKIERVVAGLLKIQHNTYHK